MCDTNKIIRTGIFGGSFNPVHNGHIELARQILDLANLDEIWLMVSPQNPLKRQDDLLDDNKRMQMMRLALADEPHLFACDYEQHLPRPSYTYDTLKALCKDYPNRTFILIIGADNWACFHKWRNNQEIISTYPIVIYPRRSYPINPNTLPQGVALVDMKLLDISSTDIRRKINEGEDISTIVHPMVKQIIESEGLYRI